MVDNNVYEKWIKEFEDIINIPSPQRLLKAMERANGSDLIESYEYYGYSTILKNYRENAKKGHHNRQHWYPSFLLKYFQPPKYHLVENQDKSALEMVNLPKGVKPWDELYSDIATWSDEIEGIFTGIENIFNDFVRFRILEPITPEKIANLIKTNEAAKISFSVLTMLNIMRNPHVVQYLTYVPKENYKPSYEDIFKDEENISYFLQSAIFLSFGSWEVHINTDNPITFSEEMVKLVPQIVTVLSNWEKRYITNSAVYIPLSNTVMLITIPTAPEGFWPNTMNYHSVELANITPTEYFFELYNWSNFKFNKRVFSINKNIGFGPKIHEFLEAE